MNKAIIAEARRFMSINDEPEWGEICASCGLARAAEKKAKALTASFNQVEFFLFDSPCICRKCLEIFASPDSRSKCLYWPEQGKKIILPREDVLQLLSVTPSAPFVLSVPYSFQKHHWFEAGLSQNGRAYVGTEHGCVDLDYTRHDIAAIIRLVLEMLAKGVPRKEMETGSYSTFTLARFGSLLDEWEKTLAPLRVSGAIRLFVTYAPARKIKTKFTEDVKRMFNDHEQTAIQLLCSLARASSFRKNDGLRFWQGFFKSRVIRYMDEEINIFFSQTAKDISCQTALLETDLIGSLSENDGLAVMEQIRAKPDLLLAAAFSELKEARDAFKSEEKPSTPQKNRNDNDHYSLI